MSNAAVLLDLEQLDVELQLAVGRDARLSLVAVGKVGGDGKSSLATDRHALDANIPALDDFTLADLEAERRALLVCCGRPALVAAHDCRLRRPRIRNLQSNTLPSFSLPM